jgi:hypothetical protein
LRKGLNTDSLGALGLKETVDHATNLGLDCVEFGLGEWSSLHLDIGVLPPDTAIRDRLHGILRGRPLTITALNASGDTHPGDVGPNDRQVGLLAAPNIIATRPTPRSAAGAIASCADRGNDAELDCLGVLRRGIGRAFLSPLDGLAE